MSKPTDPNLTLAPSAESTPDWPQLWQSEQSTAYWNILQKNIACLDLVQLDHEGKQFAENLIRNLLDKGQFQAELKGNLQSNKNLQHFYQESKNRLVRKGRNELGLGFPLLVFKDSASNAPPIVAPLFIWPVELQASPNRINAWTIKYNEKSGLEPNYYLIKLLEDQVQKDLLNKYQQLGLKSRLDQTALSRWCYDLIVQLELADQRSIRELMPIPDAQQLKDLAKRGAVCWSGALSLFSAQSPPRLADQTATSFSTDVLPKHDHPFGLLKVDPHQKKSLTAAQESRLTLVKGWPGSGKTYALCNLLFNALSNGKRCLVISENPESFAQIKKHLEQFGLQHLMGPLPGTVKDQYSFLEQLKEVSEQTQKTIDFDETAFNLFLNKCQRDHHRLTANYQALKAQNFGEHNWSETVGYFLHSNRSEGKELLRSQLNPNDFVFDYSTFQNLTEAVLESEPLYRQLGTFKHPLQNLNEQIFKQDHQKDARNLVEQQSRHFLKKASQLHHRYILKTDEYAESLTDHYEHHFRSLANQVREIEENIGDGISQFGDEFAEPGMAGDGKLRVYGVFNNKYKNILTAREQVIEGFYTLRRLFEGSKYFDFQFQDIGDQRKVKKIQQNLVDFKIHLNPWQKAIPAIVQEEIQRLSNKTVHPDMDYHAQIEDLEYALDLLVEELNESELYQNKFENKMLTIPMRQQYLESIIEQLDATLYNVRDFEVFFDWHQYWLQLSPTSQKLIHALIKVKPNNWLAAFESWYLHNRLNQDYLVALPQNDQLFQRFSQSYQELQKLLPAQIERLWQKKRKIALKQLRKNNKNLYQSLFKKDPKTTTYLPFQSLWQAIGEVLPNLFPISTCRLASAREILSQHPFEFDWLIFDEAQDYDCHGVPPCLVLGQQMIAFTNEMMEAPASMDSLAQWMKSQGAAQVVLKNQQRPIAKSIAHFNQQILFQQEGATLSNELDPKNAMGVFAMQGDYDETQKINQQEAEQVIRLLNKIEKTAAHLYPKVAVVATTAEQRNYIAQLLLEIKQRKSMGHEKMMALEAAGLGIYELSEMSGLHPEVLIFSLTFGYTKTEKRLSEDIDLLQSEAGLQTYRLLASRPSQQFIFVHSLSKELLDSYLLRPRANTLALLALHIRYAQAVQDQDLPEQRRILYAGKSQKKTRHQASLFIQELANDLKSYLGANRIVLNASIEDLRLPLVIKPIHKLAPPFVIQVDGFFSDSETGAFLWEEQLRDKLRFLGLEYYPVWSVNWWKNPKQEARKLASIIIKKDAAFAAENQTE